MANIPNGTGGSVIQIELYTTGVNANAWEIGFQTVEHAYIIEDLFSFCMTGKILFNDHIGISEFGPLTGNEKIRIRFGNTAGDAKFKTVVMDIFKINKIDRVTDKRPASTDLVELILVDQFYHSWHSNAWSKSWVNTSISDIIKDISKNHIGIDDFDDFEGSQEKLEYFDTHTRTPAECISWLMNRASGNVTKQPGYVYYHANNTETEGFGHTFVTLEKLMRNTKWMQPYDESNNTRQIASYVFENQNPDYINKIKDHEIRAIDLNALSSLSGGVLKGYDIRRKKLIKRDFTYTDAVGRFTVLGKKTLFPSDIILNRPITKVDGYSDETIMDNIWFGNWVKEYAHQQLVSITVDGHPQRKAGGMIRIIWPTHAEAGDELSYRGEVFNKQMDGRYMVKSVTHYFDKSLSYGWQQKLVCIKNGYKDSPNPNLVPAKNTNL